jgi:hypothetical protein
VEHSRKQKITNLHRCCNQGLESIRSAQCQKIPNASRPLRTTGRSANSAACSNARLLEPVQINTSPKIYAAALDMANGSGSGAHLCSFYPNAAFLRTVGTRLADCRGLISGLCRQSLGNMQSAAQPRPAPPIARCSYSARWRKVPRDSNCPWMNVNWQVPVGTACS